MSWLERHTALTPPKGVVAMTVVFADGTEIVEVSAPLPRHRRYFEIGSLTKTLTATLLADLAISGSVSLRTKLSEVVGARAGAAGSVTLHALATHTSGLPRLAPNAMKPPFWPRDPYRFFTRRRLIAALAEVSPSAEGLVYSNFGYDVLAFVLEEAVGKPLNALLAERVFDRAGMAAARCQPGSQASIVRGHGSFLLGGRRWHKPTPGSGGVDLTVADLTAWCRVNLMPERSPLDSAVRTAQEVQYEAEHLRIGLAWHHRDGLIWHNGATGRFQSALVICPGVLAAGALASCGPQTGYDLGEALVGAVLAEASPGES